MIGADADPTEAMSQGHTMGVGPESGPIPPAHGGRQTAQGIGRDRGAAPPDLPAVAAPAPWTAGTVPAASPPRGLKILLVEDCPDILQFLALILRERGHAVTEAPCLAAARAAAAAGDFDLLISDIELPDGTGLELMADWGRRRAVPGLALSGYGSKEDVEQSRRAGFAAHLTKPLDVRRLEALIARLRPVRAVAAAGPPPGGTVFPA